MNTLSTLVYFVLSLLGVDLGSHVYVDRIRSDGADTLYSKVVAQPTSTRFECLRSASGECYYTVFVRGCPATSGSPASIDEPVRDCQSRPVERFALAKGGSRQMPALPAFRLCVSTEAARTGSDCDASAMAVE
jgi:hypothetical protein